MDSPSSTETPAMSQPAPAKDKRVGAFGWPTHTHWSVVLTAAEASSPDARSALEELCRTYWYPVYAYVRHRGHARPDAQDLTQDFFLHLLETHALTTVSPERGRFRAFLLASLDHWVISEWRRTQALKRGGGIVFLSWERDGAEARYLQEAVSDLSPERLFERSWAYTVLRRVLDQLQEELATDGKAAFFEAIKERLLGDGDAAPYADLARQLGTSEAGLKMAVRRLRERYHELLRREIAHTVVVPGDIEDELRHLLEIVSA